MLVLHCGPSLEEMVQIILGVHGTLVKNPRASLGNGSCGSENF